MFKVVKEDMNIVRKKKWKIYLKDPGELRGGGSLIFELKNKLVGINNRIDIVTKYKGTRRNGNRHYSKLSTERKKRKIWKVSVIYIISLSATCI